MSRCRQPGRRRWLAPAWLLLTGLVAVGELGAEVGLVVANGIPGNATYRDAFRSERSRIVAAIDSLDPAPGARVTVDGRVETAEDLLEAIETTGARPLDVFVLVLLGHASHDVDGWRFNVSGPDVTAEALVAALATVEATRQIVIVSTSASGALLEPLAQPGRVVMTATKSGGEVNAVRFTEHLARVLESASGDLDRNEIMTVAEAFRAARAATARWYEEQGLLASEHARLAGEDAAELPLAYLGSLRRAQADPEVAALLDRRLSLEADFRALTARKPELPRERYYAELETLLLAIARLQASIDRATGWQEDQDA